jgi:hypothetical protein
LKNVQASSNYLLHFSVNSNFKTKGDFSPTYAIAPRIASITRTISSGFCGSSASGWVEANRPESLSKYWPEAVSNSSDSFSRPASASGLTVDWAAIKWVLFF